MCDIEQARLLLNDLSVANDASYVGSLAFSLGCIHRRFT